MNQSPAASLRRRGRKWDSTAWEERSKEIFEILSEAYHMIMSLKPFVSLVGTHLITDKSLFNRSEVLQWS